MELGTKSLLTSYPLLCYIVNMGKREELIAWSIVWEGCFVLRAGRRYLSVRYPGIIIGNYSPAIYLSNTNLNVLEKFKEIAGCGKIQSSPPHPSGKRKQVYRWCLQRKNLVKRLCEEVLPYLPAKKKQAELLIEFCSLPSKQIIPRRAMIHREMKELNRRGV